MVSNSYNADGLLTQVTGPSFTNAYTYYRNGAIKSASNAVCVVTLTPEKGRIEALNIKGKIFDEVEVAPSRGVVAWEERSWLRYQ